jgi:ATP-dependent Lhr-like helicase
VLAATDPANPYGAALPWPDRTTGAGQPGRDGDEPGELPVTGRQPVKGGQSGHRAGRKAGAVVVLVGGELVLYVERGGRTLLSYVEDEAVLALAAKALADAVRSGALGALAVERADGAAVTTTPLATALAAAGFRVTPRGLRLRG